MAESAKLAGQNGLHVDFNPCCQSVLARDEPSTASVSFKGTSDLPVSTYAWPIMRFGADNGCTIPVPAGSCSPVGFGN